MIQDCRIQVISLIEADIPTFECLYQFYLYDYTDFTDWDVDACGHFPDPDLEGRWLDPHRHSFLMKVDEQWAGLAIIDDYTARNLKFNLLMREFFVMRKYRRRGIGTQFAITLFDRFPGRWLVGQLLPNTRATAFWRHVIGEYTGGKYEEVAEHGDIRQYFDNSRD